MQRVGIALAWCVGVFCVLPLMVHADATVAQDSITFARARVTSIDAVHQESVIGTDTTHPVQTIQAQVIDGAQAGSKVAFDNDFTQLSVGDTFYLRHTTNGLDGIDMYSVADPYRLPVLLGLALLFVVLAVAFGGMQGVRGLVSLVGSIILIFYVLLPGIAHGYSPELVAIGVSSLIIVLGSYITHGFNKTTSAAVLGMILTVIISGAFAYVAIHMARLSGFNSEESAYLLMDSRGSIDLLGLLFGGIMIGLLGVLYDMAIGQAIAVEELKSVGAHLSRWEIYRKAIRIGREHIGALINTLAIAYVGSSLTLLLLLRSSTGGILFTLNSELFSTEIIRILIGSIGIILAVPATTLIAVFMAEPKAGGTGHGHHHH